MPYHIPDFSHYLHLWKILNPSCCLTWVPVVIWTALNIQDYFLTATYYTWSQSLNILEYKLAIREFSCLCICMHITTALILDKIFKDSCTFLPIPYFFLYKRDINLWFCFSHHPWIICAKFGWNCPRRSRNVNIYILTD